MIGRRVALAAGALVLGAIPVVRSATSLSSSAATDVVTPFVECVMRSGSKYVAWFGYDNSSSEVVIIPTPSLNHFSPPPKDRGQTTTFEPGRYEFVFSVPFSGSLTWVLETQPALAKPDSTPCPGPPTITTTSLPDGTVGAPYGPVDVEATGGIPPLTFSATGLPAGLSIAADGTISGTPTAGGTFAVKVTATDKIGRKASKDFSLEVEGVLLECGDSTSVGGDGTPAANLTLLDEEGCQDTTVVLRAEQDAVKLIKPDSPNMFTMEISWPVENNANPVPASKIDYDGDGPDAPVQVVWCPNPGELPEGQSWCLVEQHTVIVGGGKMQVTEVYFGKNDPTWTRR